MYGYVTNLATFTLQKRGNNKVSTNEQMKYFLQSKRLNRIGS